MHSSIHSTILQSIFLSTHLTYRCSRYSDSHGSTNLFLSCYSSILPSTYQPMVKTPDSVSIPSSFFLPSFYLYVHPSFYPHPYLPLQQILWQPWFYPVGHYVLLYRYLCVEAGLHCQDLRGFSADRALSHSDPLTASEIKWKYVRRNALQLYL